MKRFKPLLILLLLAGVAAGGWYAYRTLFAAGRVSETGTFTQVVNVTRGSVHETISVVGSLEAVRKKNLQFEHALPGAPVQTLLVKAGDTVAAGDVLGAIDPAPYRRMMERAQVNLNAAENRLAKLEQPPSPLDFSKADLAIDRAELQLSTTKEALAKLERPDVTELRQKVGLAQTAMAQARTELDKVTRDKDAPEAIRLLKEAEMAAGADYTRLVAENYSDAFYQDRLTVASNARQDATDARIAAETRRTQALLQRRVAVRKAEQDLAAATAALQEAEAPAASAGSATTAASTEKKVALARSALAVREAEAALSAAQASRAKLDAGPDASQVAALEAEIVDLRLGLANAEASVTGAELIAPFEGTVLETYVSAGSPIGPKVNVLMLADIAELEVQAAIDETRIRRVQVGQRGQILFDAAPNQAFGGRVKSVPLQGKVQNGVRVFQTPLTLEGAEGMPVLVGMTANIEIEVGQADDVLIVPAMAIQMNGPVAEVNIPNPGDPSGAPAVVVVEVGLTDGINTQIVSGLAEGDRVLATLMTAPEGEFGRPMFWSSAARLAGQAALRIALRGVR